MAVLVSVAILSACETEEVDVIELDA